MQNLVTFPRSKRLILIIIIITAIDKFIKLFKKIFHNEPNEPNESNKSNESSNKSSPDSPQLHSHSFINELKLAFNTRTMNLNDVKKIVHEIGQFIMVMVTLCILCFLFGYS